MTKKATRQYDNVKKSVCQNDTNQKANIKNAKESATKKSKQNKTQQCE